MLSERSLSFFRQLAAVGSILKMPGRGYRKIADFWGGVVGLSAGAWVKSKISIFKNCIVVSHPAGGGARDIGQSYKEPIKQGFLLILSVLFYPYFMLLPSSYTSKLISSELIWKNMHYYLSIFV
jgi:hypothetical protein